MGSSGRELRTRAIVELLECSYSNLLVVEVNTKLVAWSSTSAQRLLKLDLGPERPWFIHESVDVNQMEALQDAIERICSGEHHSEFISCNLRGRDGQVVPTDVVITATPADGRVKNHVLLQIRDTTHDNSVAAFSRVVADSVDGDSLMSSMVGGILREYPIQYAFLHVVNRVSNRLEMVGCHGAADDVRKAYKSNPIDHSHPGGSAVLGCRPVWLNLRNLPARYPLIEKAAREEQHFLSADTLCTPVMSRGIPIGVLFIASERDLPRTWRFYETIDSITHALAAWIMLRTRDSVKAVGVTRAKSPLEISDRERVILRLVAEGRRNAEIAEELGYSEATVRADLSRLYRLLETSSRRDIMKRARELGLYTE